MIETYGGPPSPAGGAPEPTVQTSQTIASATHLIVPQEAWSAEQLRDFILAEITRRYPRALGRRNPAAEMAVCRSFLKRWGAKGPKIARAAFTIFDGRWDDAPITFKRFSAGCDPFFAAEIAARLPREAS